MAGCIYVGTAGWSIPRISAHRCPTAGTHLERYARLFRCAEINSSFYRPHAPATYAKWGASTPGGFSFAVKVPRLITHELALRRSRAPFEQFVAETASLEDHRGPLLVQLPPSLVFASRPVMKFFDMVRNCYDGPVVCEPRHPTWFSAGAQAVMKRFAVARVAADPPIVKESRTPGGWDGLAYFRLHGSPRMYLVALRRQLPVPARDDGRADLAVSRRLVRVRQYGERVSLRERLGISDSQSSRGSRPAIAFFIAWISSGECPCH